MASQKWADDQLGKRIKDLREGKQWSQPQLAEKLADRKTPMHATTIAKIEAGTRSVRINEAVALAEIFDVTVDGLLGRSTPDNSALVFELVALLGHARDVTYWIDKARTDSLDIAAQARLIRDGFDGPAIDQLHKYAQELGTQLLTTLDTARNLTEVINKAMATDKTGSAETLNETNPGTYVE